MDSIGKALKVLYDAISVQGRDEHSCHIPRGQLFPKAFQRCSPVVFRNIAEFHPVISGVSPDHLHHLREQCP